MEKDYFSFFLYAIHQYNGDPELCGYKNQTKTKKPQQEGH